jgi:hypothetical protein
MVKWLVMLALVPSLAHANEIASDAGIAVAIDAPPEKPKPPRDRSLGVRFGMMNTALEGHERSMFAIGAQWNLALVGSLRAMAEYDYLFMLGGEGPEMPPVRGRGHAGRIGGRFAVLDTTVKNAAFLYIGVEATAGLAYVADNYVGPQVLPHALVGARLGYELWEHDAKSQSSMFGAHILAGALITAGDVGFTFQVGMEWGQRSKR